jgi:hypothetical protein
MNLRMHIQLLIWVAQRRGGLPERLFKNSSCEMRKPRFTLHIGVSLLTTSHSVGRIFFTDRIINIWSTFFVASRCTEGKLIYTSKFALTHP